MSKGSNRRPESADKFAAGWNAIFNKEIRLHPTQKPLNVIKWILERYSNENDLIFDPFMGSGTTCVAAKQLQRRFIGIEISEKYCQIAREKLRVETLF